MVRPGRAFRKRRPPQRRDVPAPRPSRSRTRPGSGSRRPAARARSLRDSGPHARPGLVGETRPGQRDRPADKGRAAGLLAIGVAQRRSRCAAARCARSLHRRTARPACRPAPGERTAGTPRCATSASTMGNTADQPQRARSPQTASAMRPPGRSTRRISRRACAGSGMYMRPSAHSARSKPPSGSASCSASMRAKPSCAQRRAARRAAAPHRPCDRTGRCRPHGLAGPPPRPRPTQPGRCRRPRRAPVPAAVARRAPSGPRARGPAAPATAPRRRRPPGPSRSAGSFAAAAAPWLANSAAGDDDLEIFAGHHQRVRRRRGSGGSAARSGRCSSAARLLGRQAAKALCTGPYQVRNTSMKCAAER